MLKQLLIASLAVASLAATSAQAQDTRSVKVSVAGIDTRSGEGAQIMLQRIKAAARSICGPTPSNPMDRHVQFEPCVQRVTQGAVDGLANPYLTALVNSGKSTPRHAELASAK